MVDKSDNDVGKLRDRAIKYYRSIKRIKCPAFSKEIRISPEWFSHIERKDAKHRRTNEEIYMRYLCFLSLEKILCNMSLYQEYKALLEDIEVERWWQFIKEQKAVQYYAFVGIVKHWDDRHRIRVVLKEVYGREKIDFVSVMPARKMKWYNNFFWPEK